MLVGTQLNVAVLCFASHDVKSCLPFAFHEFGKRARRDEYHELRELQLQDRPHSGSETSEQNWEALKHCIALAAKELEGRRKTKKSERF